MENEMKKERKKEAKKNNPLRLIAANEDQAKFKEKSFSHEALSSSIGSLWEAKNQCSHCKAFKFKNETNFCCGKGGVEIPLLKDPPKKIQNLYSKKSFLESARAYNNILAMASIGCSAPLNYQGPNFKIQVKVYHKI